MSQHLVQKYKTRGQMKVYNTTFRKKDGSIREINFIELVDLPPGFLASKLKGNAKTPNLQEGSKLVWDVDSKDFRILNTKTIIEEIKQKEEIFVL